MYSDQGALSQEWKVNFTLENQLIIYHINNWKEKNHMTISIGTLFDKIEGPFMILKSN